IGSCRPIIPTLQYSITPIVLDRILLAQSGNFLAVITERSEYLLRMLTQHRRRPVDRRRRTAHANSIAEKFHLAHPRMLHFHRKPVSLYLRIGEDFIQGVDRRGGHVHFGEAPEPVLAPPGAKDRRQDLD